MNETCSQKLQTVVNGKLQNRVVKQHREEVVNRVTVMLHCLDEVMLHRLDMVLKNRAVMDVELE